MILARLKSETADLHARTEAAMPSLDELATRPRYTEALRALHAFHAAWEPAIWRAASASEAVPDGASRAKLPLLSRDLAALGAEPIDVLPPRPARSDATALGALYVLEGSTLGGQIITRRIAGPLGLSRDTGMAYFGGYGARTGEMWKRFGAGLEAWVAQHGRADEVVEGAAACFQALETWLRQALAPAHAGTAP